ncbi:MAG: ABC transporter permease [Planctomycetota bacterium]
MKIPALALTVRSLRTDNRSLLSYALRFLLVGFVFFTLITFQQNMSNMSAPGLEFFRVVVYIDLVAIAVIGVSFFSSVITEEKEDMTLGLLKMTGLNPVSILMGKSISRLINGLFLLLAQLPFTMLAVTMGGVDQRQVLAAYVTLGAFMLLVYGLALLASTVSKRSRGAAAITLLALAALLVGPFLGLGIVQWMKYIDLITRTGVVVTTYQGFFDYSLQANAFYRIDQIMTSGYSGPVLFHGQAISNSAMSVILFGLAWLAFNRFSLDDTASAPGRGFALIWRKKDLAKKWAGRAWGNAIEWQGFHFAAGGYWGAGFRFLGLGALFALWVFFEYWTSGGTFDGRFDFDEIGGATMLSALFVAGAHAVLLAGSLFQDEVRDQTLSSLALLPVSMGQIAYAKLRGALLALAPCLIWFGVGVALNPEDFFDILEDLLTEVGGWYLISTVVFYLHVVAILSLYARRGAAALAFGLYVLGAFVFGMFVALSNINAVEGLFVMVTFFQFLGCCVIHPWIANRLKELAAQ